jgi:hypothetical protein
MLLLAITMLLLYSGLSFALRSWDAGDTNGRRTADRRVGENFLRREITELFPMRWKDAMTLKMAFEGGSSRLRFVSSRPAGLQMGRALAGEPRGGGGPREAHQGPGDVSRDAGRRRQGFRPARKGERHVVVPGVDRVVFDYFGSENEFTEPKWH